ncbi:MAG: voltage-dependent potassium channel beta subunit [Verrucomicrobiales bacterium]|jgi:voltage-dependent potassium channel beta subunit
MTEMTYRRLGRSGLKVSTLSYGSWVTFGGQQGLDAVTESMSAARDAGCNFFDNAEAYAGGESETLMGQALQDFGWARETYVVSAKFYWGIVDDVNTKFTLNRKYLMQGIDRTLERMQMDFVDLIYCHRADKETPIEETVYAMHDIISQGKALYWGTSEWSADEIRAAYEIAERHHLHKPVMEQPEYNMLNPTKVEDEFARLYGDIGLGLTTWSPLAGGLLTGKYLDGVPEGSRATLQNHGYLKDKAQEESAVATVRRVVEVAGELDCKPAQVALAWCAANPNVSSVITGASRASQVVENMEAIEVVDALTPELVARLNGEEL